jgi:Caudovirus prohead serine protease
MNRIDFNLAAAERITKSLRDRGYKAEGKIAVKTLEPMSPTQVSAVEGQPFEITSWATRNTVDMEGEVVVPEGGDVATYFAKNRNLFVDHEYDIMKAVAKARWLKMTPGGWLVRGALINNPENPYRNQVQALAEAGNIGMSIGFEILDSSAPTNEERKSYAGASNLIRAWKLLEVSYTAMPMNGDCQSDMIPAAAPEPKSMKRVVII